MCRIVILAAAWLASMGNLFAQSLSIEGGNVFENGQICLDVSVDGFQGLVGMQFELRWDSMVLEFESATPRTSLMGFNDGSISDPTETSASTPSNILVVNWFDNDLMPRDLPDGEVILEVCFNAIGMIGSSSTMNLYDLEFTDGNFDKVDFDDVDNVVSVTAAAGDNLTFAFPTTNADSGQVICVPLTLTNFDTISQFSFGVKWDNTVLSFQNVIASTLLSGFNSSNIAVVGSDSITVSWTDVDGTGESLANGAELFELCLRVVGAPARSSLLQIGSIAANEPTGPVTDLQANNGLVIVNAPPEAEDLIVSAMDDRVNVGDNFCVPVRVAGFKELKELDLTVSWDNSVITYNRIQNLAALDGLDMSDFSTIGGVNPSGAMLSWSSPDGDGRDLNFNAILFELCFSARGAAGTSSNIDFSALEATHVDGLPVMEISNNAVIDIAAPSAPDVIFRLDTITLMDGDNGCLTMRVDEFNALDSFRFEINWNTQNVNFLNADILANVPGLDNTDMTTPSNGGSDGQLILGWADVNGVGRSLNDGTALMEICFEASGSNVNRTLVVENVDVETSTGLQVSGFGRNGRIIIPSNGMEGALTLNAGNLNLDLNASGCFPVTVEGFQDMLTMEFKISWDNNVFEYTGVQNLANLDYFSSGAISNPFAGRLNVVWIDDDATGKSLSDNTVLFEICGTGKSTGTTIASFLQEEASDTNSTVNVSSNDGEIVVSSNGGGTGDLILTAADLNLDLNASGCFPVTVEGFQDMLTMEFRIAWDNSVFEYTGIQNLASLDYFSTGSVSNPFDGQLNVVWIDDDVAGKTLPDNAVLFEICGTGKTVGTTTSSFSNMEASNTSRVLTVGKNNGEIVVSSNGGGTGDLILTAADLNLDLNASGCFPVTVEGFQDMLTMEFRIAWDNSVFEYTGIQNLASLDYFSTGSVSNPFDGQLNVVWIDDDVAGKTLPDDAVLFEICGTGKTVGTTTSSFSNMEASNTSRVLTVGKNNGTIVVNDGVNSTPEFKIETTTNNTVDQGQEICIPVTVEGFAQITRLDAMVSWDPSVFQFSSVQSIAALEGLDVGDFLGTSGGLALMWTDADNSGEDLSDGTVLFELCLNAIGNEGARTDVTISDLTVENVSGTSINTTLGNGDISINETILPGDFKLIGEIVSGVKNTQVCASISVEGFTNISELTFRVEWDDDVVDFSSVNVLSSLIGFDDMDILDPIEQPTLGASILVDWDHPSGGAANLNDPEELFEICFDLIGDFGAISNLAITSALVSDGSGANILVQKQDGYVGIDPDQDDGRVTVIAPMSMGSKGQELCVDITVRNFNNILSTEFLLNWDPNILKLNSVTNLANLPDFNQARISTPSENMTPGLLGVTWFDENFSTHTLPDDAVLFTLCFDLIGPEGSGTALNFSEVEFSESGTAIPYRSIDGYISIEVMIPAISFAISEAAVNPGQEACVEVTVGNFNSVNELDLDFSWNASVIDFSRVNIVSGLPGLDQQNFSSTGNTLNLTWANSSSTGISLADGVTFFEICFDAIGAAGSSSLVELSNASVVNEDGMNLSVNSNNGKIELNEILAISNVLVDSVSCFGGMDGEITVGVTGGSGNYTYTWDPAVGSGSNLLNLRANSYDLTIEDGTGSSVTTTIEVFEPTELISNPNVMAATPPMNNGEIDLNISGGTPPYQVDWCCGLQDDQEVQMGLPADVYSAQITDANGCIINTGDIDLNNGLFVNEKSRTEPRCHDSSDGSIEISISGGMPNYQITWSDGVNIIGNEELLNGLSVGIYFYTITDNSTPPLTTTGSIELMGNPEIVINLDVSPETNSGNDGSIVPTVSGGVPSYTYNWFNYQTSATSTIKDQFNLVSGYYRLDVLDMAGCRVTRDSIFVGGALRVSADSIVVDSISCSGECDGRITLFPSGGTGNYVYSFGGSGSTTSNTQDGFCSGDIIIIVEDANNGDQTVVQVSLSDPDPLDVQFNSMGVSMGNDGGIVLNVMGGSAPYRYKWSNGEETKDVFGLSTGEYSVTITDSRDCETVIENISVDVRTLAITIEEVQDVTCSGEANGFIKVAVSGGCLPYTFVWRRNGLVVGNNEDINNIPDGEYELEVVDQCNELLFSGPIIIDARSNLSISTDIISDYNGFEVSGFGLSDGGVRVLINDGVGPYDVFWSNGETGTFITDLRAGTYTVTVEDDLGCEKIATVTLNQPDRLNVSFDVLSVNDCSNENNGVVRALVTGGVDPYTYEWNASSDNGATASNLPSGFAIVTVTDNNNVQLVDSVFISSLTEFDIETIITPDQGNGEGAITLLVNGGDGPYTYQWNDVNNSTTSSINGLLAGNYTVVVTDFNGCSELLLITVPLAGDAPDCLESMEIFTPNGDGKNEYFVINCIENYVNDIEIYDRWGKLVFEQENYTNLWDGRDINGELLPQGAYFFVLNVINSSGQRELFKGYITLIR